MSKKILDTAATGDTGRHVVRVLLEKRTSSDFDHFFAGTTIEEFISKNRSAFEVKVAK